MTRVSADRTGGNRDLDGGRLRPVGRSSSASTNGQRVLGAVHACDRSELLFNESDATHPLLPPLTTRLLAARPASCAGHGTGPSVAITPLSFDENGLEALGRWRSRHASHRPAKSQLLVYRN